MTDRRRLPVVDLDRDANVISATRAGQAVAGALPSGTTCRVRIPADSVVGKTIVLPEAAAESLVDVLRFQVEQETPFRAEDVCFDHAVVQRDRKSKRLIVDWQLAPRHLVDAAVRRLEERGLRVQSVGVRSDDPGMARFNFHRCEGAAPRRATRRLRAALAMSLALLVAAAVAVPLLQKREATAALHEQLAAAREAGESAQRLREEVEALRATSGFVVERRLGRPTASALLRELTDLLPDDTWLHRLTLGGDELSIAGLSASSAALVARIDAHPWFRDVAYRSPILQRNGSGLEEFDLTMRLTTEGARQ